MGEVIEGRQIQTWQMSARCENEAPMKARFIEPMLLVRTEKLPEGSNILYEIKFDGYRAIAFKTGGKIHLRSRNDNDFAARYPSIAKALQSVPDETVIDGEIVALDGEGKPSFSRMLKNGLERNSAFSLFLPSEAWDPFVEVPT